MIHGAYILRRSDGSILFHKAFGDEKLDEVLVSGFLVAVSKFSSELGSGEMDSIIMKNLKFVYGAFEDTMIIFYVDHDDDDQFVREDIRKIASQFLWQFAEEVRTFKGGDINQFKKFDPEFERIIHEEARVKIVLLGEPKVGKTTIARILAKEDLPSSYEASTAPAIKKLTLDKFQTLIWDIPGEGIEGKGWEQLIRGAGVVFIVVDSTMENVAKSKSLVYRIQGAAKGAAIFAITNKQDLNTAVNPAVVERVLGVPTFGFSAMYSTAKDDAIGIIRESIMISRSGKKKGDLQSGVADELLRLKLEVDSTKREIREVKDVLAVLVKKIAQMEKR
jgi:small GTP-binding protein